MSAFFAWAMRHGARILFAVALLELIVSFVSSITTPSVFGQFTGSLDEKPHPLSHLWLIVAQAINALHTSALIFFGALVIDRLDRWQGSRA